MSLFCGGGGGLHAVSVRSYVGAPPAQRMVTPPLPAGPGQELSFHGSHPLSGL